MSSTSSTPSNTDDVLDSRDVIARIEELAGDNDDWAQAELAGLEALVEQCEYYVSDLRGGATLVRDSYFTEYAMDLASDLGGMDATPQGWPFNCIDWEKAARELRRGYTSVDFDGVTYWVR